ncbi:MAG: hypothetical protein JW904_06980 [Spirochaetales bacterium]|nr:hypothetical protein [Spirochaetales bacterium]
MGELVSRNEMSKQLMNGVGGVGAGIGLLIINGLSGTVIPWIAAGVLGVIGIGMLLSKSQKKAGVVLLGAGAVAGIAIVANLFNPLFWLAGLGLMGLGVYSIIKFFINLKKRS